MTTTSFSSFQEEQQKNKISFIARTGFHRFRCMNLPSLLVVLLLAIASCLTWIQSNSVALRAAKLPAAKDRHPSKNVGKNIDPEIANDELSIDGRESMPLCPNHERRTCDSLSRLYPNSTQDCSKNPSLSSCALNCFDVPDNSTALRLQFINSHQSVSWPYSDRIWPQMGQGRWVRNDEDCQQQEGLQSPSPSTQSMCLMNRYQWKLPGLRTFTASQACEILRERSITNIYLSGDSLSRHVSLGMLLVLTDGYYSFYPPSSNFPCAGNSLFFGKTPCRVELFEVSVCNNFTSIRWEAQENKDNRQQLGKLSPPIPRDTNMITGSASTGRTLYLYGCGCHPPNGDYSHRGRQDGIFSASSWIKSQWSAFVRHGYEFWLHGATSDKQDDSAKDIFFWMPPHYRLNIGRADESNEKLFQFLQETHAFFAEKGAYTLNFFDLTRLAAKFFSRRCGITSTLQVTNCHYYDRNDCSQPTMATLDGYHFTSEINIIKAQMIFNQLVARIIPSSAR